MNEQKRKFRRIATHLLVEFFRDSVDNAIRQHQKGLAENCSMGGMFIKTDHLFSRGSVFTLEFELETAAKIRTLIQARAIVRWVQRLAEHPGMGVEFILFNGSGANQFSDWLVSASK
jgi:hypothetical protein